MSNFKQRTLILMCALSVGALLISNLAAIKLWNLNGIAVDGGILVFPLTYILSDLIVEFYGKKHAQQIVFAGFLINLLAILVFWAVIALPAYPGWNLQEAYSQVLGFTPRIVLGSLAAYIVSNLFNNTLFIYLKEKQGIFAKSFIARALGSPLLPESWTLPFSRPLPFSVCYLFLNFLDKLSLRMSWECFWRSCSLL